MKKMKNGFKKRLLCVLSAAVLSIGVMPITAFAKEASLDIANYPAEYAAFAKERAAAANTEYYGRAALAEMPNSTALLYAYDQITAGVAACETEISVFNGTNAITKEEFKVAFVSYLRDHPEHFWLGNTYSYYFNHTDGTVRSLLPIYIMSGTELEAAKAAFDSAVGELLTGISSSMSEYDREKLLHDRLAAKISYVETGNAHNAYGAIVEGEAVCEGYAEAYQYLLQLAGLQSFVVTGESASTSVAHAWNIVRVNGKYYHVDLTWDDQPGTLYYAYFNKTESRITEDHIIKDNHYTLPVCNSEDADYFTVNGGKLESFDTDAVATMLKNGGLTARVYVTGDKDAFIAAFLTETNIYTVLEQANIRNLKSFGYSNCGREYILKFYTCGHTVSGMATSFSNDLDDVTIQLIRSGTTNIAYKTAVKGKGASYSITGVAAGTYTVKVMKFNHVTREYTVTINNDLTQDLQIFPVGDVNGNGEVDILDLVRLKCINVRNAAKADGTSADINGDGLVNAADIVSLRKLILG